MRDSNYKSIANNKAAVIITTSLYDRRALDVTADRPLVNSLNHLTYLVSLSAKVRETLSTDGGVERLIEILHECHSSTYNIADNIFNSEKKLLTAWKWTLAFQSLVLIGTRGTEKIRQKVVRAGMLPIIATVLDNYLTLHERTFLHANLRGLSLAERPNTHYEGDLFEGPTAGVFDTDIVNINNLLINDYAPNADSMLDPPPVVPSNTPPPNANEQETPMNPQMPLTPASAAATIAASRISNPAVGAPLFVHNHTNLTSDDYDNLSVDQLFKLIRVNNALGATPGRNNKVSVNNDIRRRYLIVNIIKKLREEKGHDLLDDKFINDCDYDMDNSLQFLSDMYLQDDKLTHYTNLVNSKIAPRCFTETGVVVPRDDDIVWSLQLLAYISKYPYLKEVLQNTHLIIDMSIRDKQVKLLLEKQLKTTYMKRLAIKARPTITPKSRKSKVTHNSNITSTPEPNHQPSIERSRTLPSTHRSDFMERFNPSASSSPQMMNDINSIQNDNFILDEDKLDLRSSTDQGLTENAEAEDDDDDDFDDYESDERNKDDDDDDDEYLSSLTNDNNDEGYLSKLYDSIVDAESVENDMDREIALFNISDKINRYIDVESKRLSNTIISKRKEQKLFLTNKWNYDTYSSFDIDQPFDESEPRSNSHYDDSLIEYKKVNLFPMVEKFTFLAGTDMYYWSGVIMRNACRRNDFKGGVRQCGNLECGKWERYPREFLKCRRCKRTKYCSRECQMRAWQCHRNWCIPSTVSNTTGTTATSATTGTFEGVNPPLNTGADANAISNEGVNMNSETDVETGAQLDNQLSQLP